MGGSAVLKPWSQFIHSVLVVALRHDIRSRYCTAYQFPPSAIFTLSMLMERAVEVQHDVYLGFIGYSKAFDKVKHSELFGILDQLNIDGKDLRILRNLYWEQWLQSASTGNTPILLKSREV
ncbi:RNA-directed DNA polymerase from mobile element jockey-like [Elysia marginata]|uniref:RNA-directed DNA polymerase from mobile element jockey-like n=1 Tax=Elysia marginata TaxID=1093978 RepID=A0AAV4GIR6_9GAST|nr:RNA-directed DNA polymerase from mobile element jockey-like [Elysia marginata]